MNALHISPLPHLAFLPLLMLWADAVTGGMTRQQILALGS